LTATASNHTQIDLFLQMGAAFSAPVINDVSTCLDSAPSFKNSRHAAELPENVKKVRGLAAVICEDWGPVQAILFDHHQLTLSMA
jgi:hypothetical protein